MYVPHDSHVEYVNLRSETHEQRPAGTPRDPAQLLGRRPRTDEPRPPAYSWAEGTAGRHPARVGATWTIDISTPPATGH